MRKRTLAALAALAVVVACNVGANALSRSWDLTAEQSGTLSKETLRVVREVRNRIEITAFYPRDAVGRVVPLKRVEKDSPQRADD